MIEKGDVVQVVAARENYAAFIGQTGTVALVVRECLSFDGARSYPRLHLVQFPDDRREAFFADELVVQKKAMPND